MDIIRMITGELQTNTYLITNKTNNEALIVDPAGDFNKVVEKILNLKLTLKAIMITHGHFDHITEADSLKKHFNVPVYAHKDEAEMMKDPRKNLSAYFFGRKITAHADKFVEDGEIVDFGGGFLLKCILVPGHTSNSICYYNKTNNFVITGDTLMAGSMGRTDLNNSSTSFLANNIKNKLMILPENTLVYPGHGEITKIGTEKLYNPFL